MDVGIESALVVPFSPGCSGQLVRGNPPHRPLLPPVYSGRYKGRFPLVLTTTDG